MLVGIKNVSKLIGISIIACCAVLVCTMFLNFYFDIRLIESEITSELSMFFYNAQVSTAKVVCLVSGGCLLLTAIVMLLFYIKHNDRSCRGGNTSTALLCRYGMTLDLLFESVNGNIIIRMRNRP